MCIRSSQLLKDSAAHPGKIQMLQALTNTVVTTDPAVGLSLAISPRATFIRKPTVVPRAETGPSRARRRSLLGLWRPALSGGRGHLQTGSHLGGHNEDSEEHKNSIMIMMGCVTMRAIATGTQTFSDRNPLDMQLRFAANTDGRFDGPFVCLYTEIWPSISPTQSFGEGPLHGKCLRGLLDRLVLFLDSPFTFCTQPRRGRLKQKNGERKKEIKKELKNER